MFERIISKKLLGIIGAFLLFSCEIDKTIQISSLEELVRYAQMDNQSVKLKPGIYQMDEVPPDDTIANRVERKQYQYLVFSVL